MRLLMESIDEESVGQKISDEDGDILHEETTRRKNKTVKKIEVYF